MDNRAVVHPYVIEELACGGLDRKGETLQLLRELPQVGIVSHAEFLEHVQSGEFRNAGLEMVDMHLLIAARVENLLLWTFDRKLRIVAAAHNLAYSWK